MTDRDLTEYGSETGKCPDCGNDDTEMSLGPTPNWRAETWHCKCCNYGWWVTPLEDRRESRRKNEEHRERVRRGLEEPIPF